MSWLKKKKKKEYLEEVGTVKLKGNNFYHGLFKANEYDLSIGATHRIGTWKYEQSSQMFWSRPVIIKKSVIVFLEDDSEENNVWETRGTVIANINLCKEKT